MATRPVFMAFEKAPYVVEYHPEFVWNSGFAVSQKRKNICALHEAFAARRPDAKVLEISSKSMQELGVRLSAFHLMKEMPSLGKRIPVECAFQGSKEFLRGGPFQDLYEATPRDAKRDARRKENGPLCGFILEEKKCPLRPTTAFYNWLYINALLEDPALGAELLAYDAFTDIEFNPEKSSNCQARAAALFVALSRQGLAESCRDFDTFVKLAY